MVFQHGSLRGGIPAITARLLHGLALVSLIISSTTSPALAAAPSPQSAGAAPALQDAGPTPTPPAPDPVITSTLPITPTIEISEPPAATPTFPPASGESATPAPAATVEIPLTQTLSATLAPTSTLPLQTTETPTATVEIEGAVEITASLFITGSLPALIPVTGGVAEGLGGGVKARFPEWAAAGPLWVHIRQPEAEIPNPPTGHTFEILAFDRDPAAAALESLPQVERFANPFTLEVSYAGFEVPYPDGLGLAYYDEASQNWLPVQDVQVDPKTQTLTARLDHLTVFDITYSDWEASRLPSLQPFQVSQFTGTGAYSMDFWTPPGPGGLQPQISLSYSGQSVDSAIASQTQAPWTGMGFSLSAGGAIERNQNGTPYDFGDDSFSISAGGVDGQLVHQSGSGDLKYYVTADESFWRIRYNSATDTWTAWAKDGTKYIFGDATATRAQYGGTVACVGGNQTVITPKTWKWALSSITNVFGKSLTFTYSREQESHKYYGPDCGGDYSYFSTDVALFPATINYPTGTPYRIVFTPLARNDYLETWTGGASRMFFTKFKLAEIRVENLYTGALMRRYDFAYYPETTGTIFPYNKWRKVNNQDIYTLALQSIKEYGLGGTQYLPATTFTYGDGLHLTRAENGYGGKVEFAYESDPWEEQHAPGSEETFPYEHSKTYYKNACSQNGANWVLNLVKIGTGTLTCLDATHAALKGTAQLQVPAQYLQPGASYRLSARVTDYDAAGDPSVNLYLVGGKNGVTPVDILVDSEVASGTTNPVTLDGFGGLRVENTGGVAARLTCNYTCKIDWVKVELLPTHYRVIEKKVYDGRGGSDSWRYAYDEAATNEPLHSALSGEDNPYSEKYSEYRGHAMVDEEAPSGLVTRSFFHQDDAMRGRPAVTLSATQRYSDTFEISSLNTGYWSACSGSSPATAYLRGDRALAMTGDTSFRCVLRTTAPAALGEGEAVFGQMLVNGSGALAQYLLERGSGDSLRRFGLYAKADGTLVISYNNDGTGFQEIGLTTLKDVAFTFKRDAWYAFALIIDRETFTARVWERDKPENMGWKRIVFDPNDLTGWTFKVFAKAGTAYLDTYSEGKLYSLGETIYYPESDTGYPLENTPALVKNTEVYAGPQAHNVLVKESTKLTFEGDARWTGTHTLFTYDGYGNQLKAMEGEWDAANNQWVDYRLTLEAYYPNTGTPYLVGLPGYTNTYACPSESYNGACLNWTVTTARLTGSTWYLYDGSMSYSAIPSVGKQTGQREMVRWLSGTSNARYRDRTFGYDAYGNRTIDGVYDQEGTTTFGVGARLAVTTTYDSTYHVLATSVKNALGHTTTYGYHPHLPLPTSMTGPNGPATTILVDYDAFGRMTDLARPGDTLSDPTLKVTYTDTASPYQIDLRQKISGTSYANFSKYYDGLGRLIQTQTRNAQIYGGGSDAIRDLIQDTWYNASGDPVKQSAPYHVMPRSGYGAPVSTYATLTGYDALGRTSVITATDDTLTARYTYLLGKTELKNARNYITTTIYDAWRRTAQVTPPTGPGVTYSYDTEDQLTLVVRGGVTTTLTYDIGGRKTQMIDPDMGTWVYAYDSRDNLTRQNDARGKRICLYYDKLSRLTGKHYRTNDSCPASPTPAEQAVRFIYDQPTQANGIGQRTTMIDPTGTTTYQYDHRGQLIEERHVLNNGYGTFKTAWVYNSAGLASSMSYPSDNLGGAVNGVNFSYLPQLTLGAVNGGAESYVQANRYDNAGRVVERKLGNSGTLRQRYSFYGWDTQGGRLQQLTAGTATVLDSLMKLSYTYDPNGNITTIQDHKTGGPQTQTFTYDQADRLTSAVAAGGTQGNYSLENYIYNGTTGNLASKAGMSYLYQAQEPDCPEAPGQVKAHAVVQAGTNKYCYDQNGNMRRRKIGASTYTLTYDYENQMTGVSGATTASFGYDGDGKRVAATTGGVTTVYIGNWFEYQMGSGQMTRYIYSGSERIAQVQGANPKRFLLGDHLGSTSVLANQDGSLVTPPDQKQLYKPWGEARGTTSITQTGYLFTGQFRDGYINLYWMNSRWFDPSIMRWTSPDTIIPDNYNPLDFDRYQYVRSNPLKFNDPSGHIPACDRDDWACQYHWDIPIQETKDWLMDDTETLGDVAIETVATILFEPLDWWSMAEDCYNGVCSPWMLLGLLPVIPGSVGNKVDDVVAAVTKMDGATKSVDETLDLAIEFLGEGYVDLGKGRFVSADGLRQVRMGDGDILGTHPGAKGPHINFEILTPILTQSGRFTMTNIHIFITELLK